MFRAIWQWSEAASWRSWVLHGVIAFTLSYPLGAWALFVAYAFREVEQVALTHAAGLEQDWPDHIGDVAFPFLACGLATWLGW